MPKKSEKKVKRAEEEVEKEEVEEVEEEEEEEEGEEQEEEEKAEGEESAPHGFIADIVDAVMKPGTAPVIRIVTHCAFIGLLLVLLWVMFILPKDSDVLIHIILLFVLSAGLYGAIIWFLSTGITDPDAVAEFLAKKEEEEKNKKEEAEKKKDDDKDEKKDDKKEEKQQSQTKDKKKRGKKAKKE